MAKRKKPMIDQKSRPTAIDLDAPIADWKVKDLLAVIDAQVWEGQVGYQPVPEYSKPEKEILKPEKELRKPEKEFYKPEKELIKPEKEKIKPELTKPEKEIMIPDLIERVATRVVEVLEERRLVR